MNTILLDPTDVLFFRDGRPMNGASSGHGAAWPLPSVVNQAFHAALHRAGFAGVHEHRRGRSGRYDQSRDRRFGSLLTVGPFPVRIDGPGQLWLFPRPLDADASLDIGMIPFPGTGPSSLPEPCRHAVASMRKPSKTVPKPWISARAFAAYLEGTGSADLAATECFTDADLSDTEHTYGIGMDPETGSVAGGQFYSAHYLRLKPHWRLGVLGEARDKDYRHPDYGADLVRALLNGRGTEIVAGGQQRVCTAELAHASGSRLPLPCGPQIHGTLVKWVLLTPAVWPCLGEHPGGWLPSWIDRATGEVHLLDGPGKNAARRRAIPVGNRIHARLVAATTGKPTPVTGYAFPSPHWDPTAPGGAKSTHLAVPAGSVYYFEAESEPEARKLAAALNWHGETAGTEIRNRRSTLMGEKGFGLGVCSTWEFHRSAA